MAAIGAGRQDKRKSPHTSDISGDTGSNNRPLKCNVDARLPGCETTSSNGNRITYISQTRLNRYSSAHDELNVIYVTSPG